MNRVMFFFFLARFWVLIFIEGTENFFRKILFGFPKAVLPTTLQNKTVVITGANRGIGLETCKVFVKLHAKVIMACRNVPLANQMVEEMCNDFGEEFRTNISVVSLDLASFESINKCCMKILCLVDKIDYLINNAGIMMCDEQRTKDGFEYQFGCNYLGHFLLTHLLMSKILASKSARIVNLSSIAHNAGVMHFDNINLIGVYTPVKAYGQSKLANLLFTKQLAKELANTSVTTYAVHPGLVDTELYETSNNPFIRCTSKYNKLGFITPVQGIQTTLYCAFDPSIQKETGHYYKNCRRVDSFISGVNDEDAKKLWELSLCLCELTQQGDSSIV